MRVRSFLALVGVVGLFGFGVSVTSLGGCGGSTSSGISVANPSRDLGGFVVSSQSGSPDAAMSTGTGTGTGPGTTPDMATSTGPGTGTGGSSSCGSVTEDGDCSGTTLEYCDPTEGLQTIDCSSQGLTCKVDSSTGEADCVAGSTGGSGGGCGNVTTDGDCQGHTLEYCSSTGTLKTKDCSASGESCKVSSSGYASCQ